MSLIMGHFYSKPNGQKLWWLNHHMWEWDRRVESVKNVSVRSDDLNVDVTTFRNAMPSSH